MGPFRRSLLIECRQADRVAEIECWAESTAADDWLVRIRIVGHDALDVSVNHAVHGPIEGLSGLYPPIEQTTRRRVRLAPGLAEFRIARASFCVTYNLPPCRPAPLPLKSRWTTSGHLEKVRSMMNTWQLRFAILWVLANGISEFCFAAEPPDGNPRTVYFTVGDTQELFDFPPLDSRASIAMAFETLQQQWQVERIWWRGGQDEVWGKQFVIRPENRQFAKIWDWWRDLQYRTIGTNRIAVEEAHRRGMKIWLTYGLFDNGSQADAGYVGFPYAVEDKLRVDHPEWAPANRWGTWRQGGPIEFAYPEARQAMADYLTKYVVEGNYDGISFLTYAENFSQRYEDEFGYSAPIVEEFRKEYGVDIRREEFDRDAWRQMRGRHVTQFLRLLKKQLAAHGKQIAVCVHGQHPEKPMQWNVDGGVQTAGNFRWSVDDWLKGDVVDEIDLFTPASDAVIARLMAKIREQQSPVRLTVFRSRGNLPPKVPRVMFLGREIESGYDSEHWIDYPDEVLTPEPIDSLASQDVYAHRRVLTLALKAKQPLTPAQLSQAVSDPDMYVRRIALRTIAQHKVQGVATARIVRRCAQGGCMILKTRCRVSPPWPWPRRATRGNADIARGGIRSQEHVPI